MTPELGRYLHDNGLAKVRSMLTEYDWITPDWFISCYEGTQSEGAIHHLMEIQRFMARAYVIQEPRNELYKWLDAPFFARGDLYYIQHLVAVLEAPEPVPAEVVAEHIFRNNSAADGNNPAANAADDNAILAAKTPVEPGQPSSGSCVSSYAKGLNGLMVDINGAANAAAIAAGDFDVQTSPTGAAGSWVAAVAPTSVTVRLGAGQDGSDRVTVIWADGAIKDCWVRVEVKATANTGLAEPDVCYWGNLRGDVTSDCATNVMDLLRVQQNYLLANPDQSADVTGDGNVNVFDLLLVRQQYLNQLTAFQAP